MNDNDKQLLDKENVGKTVSFSNGAMNDDVVADVSQVMEGKDDADEDLYAEVDTFERAFSEPAAAAPTTIIRSSETAAAILKPVPAIYYLAGGGDSDCSRERWSPYMVNRVDVSDIIWNYRSKILRQAELMKPLGSVERL